MNYQAERRNPTEPYKRITKPKPRIRGDILNNKTNLYTPEMAGSGQHGTCAKCKKEPTKEGHDGCIGTLPSKDVMNACCGHGSDNMAYVQFWSSPRIAGQEAIDYINKNKP